MALASPIIPISIEEIRPLTPVDGDLYWRSLSFIPGYPADTNLILIEGSRRDYPNRHVLACWGYNYVALYVHADNKLTVAQFRDDVYRGFLLFSGWEPDNENESKIPDLEVPGVELTDEDMF